MKTYINIILTLFCFNSILAQETIAPLTELGVYDKKDNITYYFKDLNNDLDKFTGTWFYSNTTQEFTIMFIKLIHKEGGGTFYDDIYAKIKFVENGITIYDTLNDNSPLLHNDISGANLDQNNLNNVSIVYQEYNNIPVTSTPSIELEYVPCLLGTNCEQLIWHNTYLKETANEPWPFVIPIDMVLTKQ